MNELHLKLSKAFIDKVKRMIEHFSTDENEATRSHQLIALLLNEIMDKSEYLIRYTAQNVDANGQKPDFLLTHGDHLFFILEAKAALSSMSHKELIKVYLKTSNLKYGCLSDGISWTMLKYDEKGDKITDLKNLVLTDPQAIVNYILSKV